MATTGPPAGWYPDPAGTVGHRWWDGMGWASTAAPATGNLEDEATPARWAKAALLVAAPAQIACDVMFRHDVRTLIDHWRAFADGSATPPWLGRGGMVAMETLGGVTTITGVLFLIWFVRSAHNARVLGLPGRREPAAAVAGFIVPIINLWWPYQSTCDLAPDEASTRRLVLAWFLLWTVGGFVGGAFTLASAFVDSWLGYALLAVPAALVTLAALAARQVVATVVEIHASLA